MPNWLPEPPRCEVEERDGISYSVLVYYAHLADGGTELRRQTCSGVCVAGLPWANCTSRVGEVPWRLCLSAGDCAVFSSYCERANAPTRVVLGSPECVDSICDWKTKAPEACPSGTTCTGTTCSGQGGSTSGGFPWGTGGSGGSGGYAGHD